MRYLIILFSFLFTTSLQAQQQEAVNMTLLGGWDNDGLPMTSSGNTFNECFGYAANGREYAVIGSTVALHFFDVTDPENPELIGEFEGGNETTWRDMKTWGNYMYAVSDVTYEGLLVFDLSYLPDSVVLVNQTTEIFERSHNIFIDENIGRLYVVGSSINLRVFDIAANPVDPVHLINTSLPGAYVHDIYVRDNIGYASHLSNGLYIYDFTDLENIQTLGTLTTYPGEIFNHSNWLSEDGQTLVFCDEKRGAAVKALDVSDFTDLFVEDSNLFSSALLAPEHTNSIAHNPLVKDNLAFVSYYHDGVQVFDISDINDVQRVAYYDSFDNSNYDGFDGVWGVYPFLPSGIIIASDRQNGLLVLQMDTDTAVEDVEDTGTFELYPNPVNDLLYFNFKNKIKDNFIQVSSVDGKVIYYEKIKDADLQNLEIDMGNFPEGLYFINVNNQVKKVVRN